MFRCLLITLDVLTVNPRSTKSLINSGQYPFTISADQHARACVDFLARGGSGETWGHYWQSTNPPLWDSGTPNLCLMKS